MQPFLSRERSANISHAEVGGGGGSGGSLVTVTITTISLSLTRWIEYFDRPNLLYLVS